MKTILPLFAVLALSPHPAVAATEREDAVAILRAVIGQEAEDLRSWSSGPLACVSRVMKESTFAGFRRRRTVPLSDSNPTSSAQRPIPIAFTMRRQPGDPEGRMLELEPGEIRQLEDAVAAIIAEDDVAPAVTRLRSDWLTPPFRLCERKRFGLLHLSSPAIRGDFAFVSLDFDCVLCGHGIDYALRRRDRGWQIISENTRWVS